MNAEYMSGWRHGVSVVKAENARAMMRAYIRIAVVAQVRFANDAYVDGFDDAVLTAFGF